MHNETHVEPVEVLYIGGEGRSGSTILSALLGNYEGFFPVGELRDIWQALKTNELCGCGQSFSRCEFWCRIGEQAFGGWDRIDVDRMLRLDDRFARQRRVPRLLIRSSGWARSDDLFSYRQLLGRLYFAIRDVSDCTVIVDATKDPAYALLLSKVPGVDLRLVHLVRDSRGVAYSWSKKQVERPEYAHHPLLRGTFMGSRSPWRSAVEWDIKNMLFHCFRLAARRQLVRYESLAAEPAQEIARILRLADGDRVSSGEKVLPCREFELSPFHTLGGNRVRFNRGQIRLSADYEWKTRMRLPQRSVVGALTLPLLIAYGYIRPSMRSRTALRNSPAE